MAILVVLITSVVRIVIARGLVPRGDLLAMGLLQLFKLRNDKVRGQVQGCHGEESFKTTRPSVGKLSSRTQCGDLVRI